MKKLILVIVSTIISFGLQSQDWEKLPGPLGVDISDALINKDGIIVALSLKSDVWLSNSGGVSWEKINSGLNTSEISHIHQQLYTSASGDIYLLNKSALYLLNLNTKFWQTQNSQLELITGISFMENGNIYYSSDNKIYRSVNKGETFNLILTASKYISKIVDGGSNTKYYVNDLGSLSELYRFDNDGSNLKLLNSSIPGENLYCNIATGTLFINDFERLYRSTDNGSTWSNVKIDNVQTLSNNKMLFSKDKKTFSFNNGGLYQSTNDGLDWNKSPLLLSEYYDEDSRISISDINNILFQENNKITYLKNLNSIIHLILPENNASVFEVQTSEKGELLCYSDQGITYSSDSGQSWENLGSSKLAQIWLTKDGSLFKFDSKLMYSLDHNKSWQEIKLPSLEIINISINNKNHVLYFDQNHIYFTNDFGKKWVVLDPPINDINYVLSNNDIIYSTNSDSEENIWLSFDLGGNWSSRKLPGSSMYGYNTISDNNVLLWLDEKNTIDFYYSFDFGITNFRLPYIISGPVPDLQDDIFIINESIEKLYIQNIYNKRLFSIHIDKPTILNSNNHLAIKGWDGYLYLTKSIDGLYRSTTKWFASDVSCSGQIIRDEDNNCQFTQNKDLPALIELNITNTDNGDRFRTRPNQQGYFNCLLDKGNYKLEIADNSILWKNCNFPSAISVNKGDNINLGELLVQPKEFCPILNIDISGGIYRRCFNNNYAIITIGNQGTEDAINQKIFVELDPFWDNVISSIPFSSRINNFAQFIIPSIPAGESIQIELTFTISCNATLGQIHCLKAILQELKDCKSIQHSIDTIEFCQANRGSFDPNDKQAFEKGHLIKDNSSPNSVIEYLIRFQNSGTDTAFNIIIKDQLDSNLDWTSFEATSASNPYTYELDKKGLLTIFFTNIFLPDSNTHEMGSHGFFKYRIKQKKDLPLHSSIQNTVSIYFDYNDPIITNTVKFIVKDQVLVSNPKSSLNISANPNPFMFSTTLSFPDEISNEKKIVMIYNLEGNLISQFSTFDNSYVLKNSTYTSQSLFLKLISETGKTGIIKLFHVN